MATFFRRLLKVKIDAEFEFSTPKNILNEQSHLYDHMESMVNIGVGSIRDLWTWEVKFDIKFDFSTPKNIKNEQSHLYVSLVIYGGRGPETNFFRFQTPEGGIQKTKIIVFIYGIYTIYVPNFISLAISEKRIYMTDGQTDRRTDRQTWLNRFYSSW